LSVSSTVFVIRHEEVPDEWEPPQPQPYVDQGNLHYYMLDPDAYDQYCTVTGGGSTVQIWQNSSPEPTKLEERAVRIRLVMEGFEYHISFILLSELLSELLPGFHIWHVFNVMIC
jgi:hypothetical protein